VKYFLLTKKTDWGAKAAALAQVLLDDVEWISGDSQKPLPYEIQDYHQRAVLISFLSPWIIPANILARHVLAINFHPGSTEYPGIGCYNFAIYEGATTYGATCHHMAPQVDTGPIIMERRFHCTANETVESLKLRTMVLMLGMCHDIFYTLAIGDELPTSNISWARKPFTRRQLNELGSVRLDMPPEEIERRVRASTYPGFRGASISVQGQTFVAPTPRREPLA
jgi:methionyl-tRNA formyltransferase